MPCETSRSHDEEMFSQIETDIVTLKARYKIPICLSGYFNAHTGQDDDFINPDDFLVDITGCDMLGEEIMKPCKELLNPNLTFYIYNQEKAEVNRNGKQLWFLCQGLDLRIVNERLGSDKYLGGSTCQKTNGSVIEYVIVCEDMLPYVSDFNTEMFDSCMSDVHSPLEFVLVFNHCDKTVGNTECLEEDRSVLISHDSLPNVKRKSNALQNMKFQWNAKLAVEFQNVISDIDFTILTNKLYILSQNITEDGKNKLSQCLNAKILETATKAGFYKEMNTSNHKKAKAKSPSPPWFDHECSERRAKIL